MTTPSTTKSSTFSPYIPPTEAPRELTIGALVLGVLLGLVFAASSIYLALKVSLTVSASIPIAVLSITIFRWLGESGRVPEYDLRRALNMGIGMILVVAARDADAVRKDLLNAGEANSIVIGEIVRLAQVCSRIGEMSIPKLRVA